jgi:hypothetical protein
LSGPGFSQIKISILDSWLLPHHLESGLGFRTKGLSGSKGSAGANIPVAVVRAAYTGFEGSRLKGSPFEVAASLRV